MLIGRFQRCQSQFDTEGLESFKLRGGGLIEEQRWLGDSQRHLQLAQTRLLKPMSAHKSNATIVRMFPSFMSFHWT